jgi:hypothetical protein
MDCLPRGNETTSPTAAAPLYTVKFVTRDGNQWTLLYVPSADKIRSMAPIGEQTWWLLPLAARDAFRGRRLDGTKTQV